MPKVFFKKLSWLLFPISLSIIVFLFFQLQVFNQAISYRDEGFFFYNALQINKGEVPYRDFFATTTPGSFYLLAILIKIFGSYLIIGRILYITLTILTLFFASKVFNLRKYWNYFYLISLSLAFVFPGGFAYYNTEAIFLTVSGFYFLLKGIEKKNLSSIALSGVLSSLSFFFKQSIGGLTFFSFLLIILLYSRKNRLNQAITYSASAALTMLCFITYLFLNKSLNLFFYYSYSFAKMVKSHRASFLIQRLVFIPLTLVLFKFLSTSGISKLKKVISLLLILLMATIIYFFFLPSRFSVLMNHLHDPLFYFFTLAFFLPLAILAFPLSKDKAQERLFHCSAIASLGLFLSLGSSGYELGVIKSTTIFLVPLFIHFALSCKEKFRVNSLLVSFFIVLGITLYSYFVFSNPLKKGAKIYNVYPRKILNETLNLPETKFIKVSPEEKKDVTEVVTYIKANTKENERILCFPYCPMIFVLTQRNNISYFSIFYFETFLAKDQSLVIREIKTKNPSFIIVQKNGYIENEADFENNRLRDLKEFLFENSKVVLSNNNFMILQHKSQVK